MSVATYLERVKTNFPSGHTLLKIILPTGLGFLLGAVIMHPHHRTIEILAGFFIAAAAILVKPSRAIAAFVVIFLFPARLSIGTSNTVFMLILFSAWAAQQVIAGKRLSVRTPLDLPILVMAAAYMLSLINVPHGTYGANLRGLSVFFTSVMIYYLIVNLTTDTAAVLRLLFAGAIGAGIIALLGLYEISHPGRQLLPYFLTTRGPSSGVDIVRAGSAFSNVSVLSQYSVFYLLIGALLFGRERSRFLRVLMVLFFAAFLTILVSTAMRGAIIAGALGLAFLVWRSNVAFHRGKIIAAILLCVVVFLIAHQVLSSAGLVPNIWERFGELEHKGGSHVQRAAVMREVFARSLEHPFIGHGPVVSLSRGFIALGSENPHCQYLLYFYTIGLLGLGGFIWLMVSLFRTSSGALRLVSSNKSLMGLMVVLQTFLVVFTIHETVDDYSSSSNYPLFIWYVFGLIVATRNVLVKEAGLRTDVAAPAQK
ncbi:MAG: O-antigen ligase family protein [Candidatus Eisenbacteria bacterium]|nr:O-antigen ligase family protein [Candidatus Eisenbacteria bacterium]